MTAKYLITAAIAAVAILPSAATAATLDDVKAKGFIQCGSVSTGLPGFASPDAQGEWTGFDIDFCRAVASAIFNDASKVKFTPTTGQTRLTALQSGEIDILSRATTWTIGRDTSNGLNFRAVTYYDGQGFLVPKALEVTSALELSGAAVCVQTGTTTEMNLADYFTANGLEYNPVVFEKAEEVNAAYLAGRCDVFTTDQSALYAMRLSLPNPAEHTVLPEVISKEPLGPAVRHGDDQWLDIVSWTHYAMVQAEEFGITSDTVDTVRETTVSPDIRRFLDVEADNKIGENLGLDKDWAYNIIKNVGSYGEVFERNLGQGSPLLIERGLNALWTDGGLQYAPPIR